MAGRSGVAQPSAQTQRGHVVALTCIFVLAVVLRLVGRDYSLWYDELASIQFASEPLSFLWSSQMISETNPPLFYTLLKAWQSGFGSEDSVLRLLPILIGCIGILLAYPLGRRVGGPLVGLLAAALLCLSAQHVMYSQQLRGYILAHTATLAALLGTVMFLDRMREGRAGALPALALYVISVLVALYSHTLMVLLPAFTSAFIVALVLLRKASVRTLLTWAGAQVVVLVGWAWWGWITWLQLTSAPDKSTIGWIGRPSFPYAVRMTLESYVPWGFPLEIAAAAFFAGCALLFLWRTRSANAYLLPTVWIAAPVTLYLASLAVPVFLPRTVYFASGAFLVCVAAGIVSFRGMRITAALAAVALAFEVAGLVSWWPEREIEPWRTVVERIEAIDPAAVVVTTGVGPYLAVKRYCTAPECHLDIRMIAAGRSDHWAREMKVTASVEIDELQSLLHEDKTLVFVRWLGDDSVERIGDARLSTVPVSESISLTVAHAS